MSNAAINFPTQRGWLNLSRSEKLSASTKAVCLFMAGIITERECEAAQTQMFGGIEAHVKTVAANLRKSIRQGHFGDWEQYAA